ncbi:MAG: hypothetical protein BGO41_00365 [Clostridiales bacterium 38-18]|nr:MAG: hypothetical protein BGO41_00365 [Clostridiales bacterium 38-18]
MKNSRQKNREKQVEDDFNSMKSNVSAEDVSQSRKDLLALIFIIGLMLSGVLYIFIQLIHPRETIDVVKTNLWIMVAILTMIMSLLNAAGFITLYVREHKYFKGLGKASFILLVSFWLLSAIFSFNEAFVLPLVEDTSRDYVIGMMGLFDHVSVPVSLGIFPVLTNAAGILYVLGGLGFGLSLSKSVHYSKFATLLFAFASFATIAASVVPHPYNRIFAFPMGIALIALGCNSLKMYK